MNDSKNHLIDRDFLQGVVALHCHLGKMDGYFFDKKAMRYSAITDYMMLCTLSNINPSTELAMSSLNESIETALVDHPQCIEGEPFCLKNYEWMIV